MVQDELKEYDKLYEIEKLKFLISKEDDKEISYLEIDYTEDWAGERFIITSGF